MSDLVGKAVLITGSTRGIGWATAREFAAAGARVAINGTSDSDLVEERAATLRSQFDVDAMAAPFDVTSPAAVKEGLMAVHKNLGALDVLVNNAGVLEPRMLGTITDDVLDRMIAVNVVGTIQCLQLGARLMQRAKAGSIVNVSSILGTNGAAGQVAYSATKAAVVGITKSAAKELAPFNIRVNAVAPGYIETDMTADLEADVSIGLGRPGSPEDVAHAIVFLASDQAQYITGHVLSVDGGMLI